MSPHWREGRALPIAWSVEAGDGPLQGPLALEFLRGRRLDLQLAPGQSALLLDAGRLRAVYGPGRHLLDVGDDPGALDPRWRLQFLAFGEGLSLRWTAGSPLRCGGDDAPALVGACRVAITDPAAFHGTFLAGVEHPDTPLVLALVDRLVQAAVAARLSPDSTDGLPLTGPALQARLAALAADDLRESLAPCGLSGRALELQALVASADGAAARAEPAATEASRPTSGHSGDLRRH